MITATLFFLCGLLILIREIPYKPFRVLLAVFLLLIASGGYLLLLFA